MSTIEIGLLSLPLLLLLIFMRIPIALSMMIVAVAGTGLVTGSNASVFSQMKYLPYATFSSYSLSIVPLFLLMGQFSSLGGLSTALFNAAKACLGHKPGGIAMAAIGGCAGFGAICGSSLATAATMTQVALPELRRHHYSDSLATGTLAAGGTLGILIPPSVILVIFAILTEQNIAKLFVAALIPAALAIIGYIMTIRVYVFFQPDAAGSCERAESAERTRALLEVWPVCGIFLLVTGGIYTGIFTPTEAAAVGAGTTGVYAALRGSLTWKNLQQAILETASTSAMILFIVLGAAMFNSFLALTQVPQQAALFVASQSLSPWLILTLVLLLYFLFGFIMDSLSMVLLTVPIIYPIMLTMDYGMSPTDFGLWFGILILIVIEVGLITPPVGMNLFVINNQAPDISLQDTYRGVLPFVLADVLRIIVLVLIPSITLGAVWLLF